MQSLIGSCGQTAVKRRKGKWYEGLAITEEHYLQMDEEVRAHSSS